MKNLPLILSIVLLVAVGVLYYFHFSSPKSVTVPSGSSVVPSDIKIAYLNTDSVLEHYEYFKVAGKSLEEKGAKLDQELRNRAQGLQNEIANYQQTVNNLTLSQAKALEEDLGKKQQNLQAYQQRLGQQFSDEQAKLMKDIYDRLTAFSKKYSVENGILLVLKHDAASDVLYGGESIDITKDVVDGLNKDYETEKATVKPAVETPAKTTK